MEDKSVTDANSIESDIVSRSPEEIIRWAFDRYGDRMFLTCSFQTHSIPLLHMASIHAPDIEIVFLDTGFHFEETILFRDQVANLLNLRVRSLRCDVGHAGFLSQFGALYSEDPDRCCFINKTDPLNRFLSKFDAWMTGIRKDQSSSRANVPVLNVRDDGKLKIAPLANVTKTEIDEYIARYHLPGHPLTARGYRSIGCYPCTRVPVADGDERAGRWAGTSKTECGLHDDYFLNKEKSG